MEQQINELRDLNIVDCNSWLVSHICLKVLLLGSLYFHSLCRNTVNVAPSEARVSKVCLNQNGAHEIRTP